MKIRVPSFSGLYSGGAPRREIVIAAAAIMFVILFSTLTSFFTPHGLAFRWDPLASPPYIERLRSLQEGGLYRSYSLDSDPQPAFAAPFQLASIDNLDALLPMGAAKYFRTYLDRGAGVLFFAGNFGFRSAEITAMSEFHRNRRYFDFVAVKYLVTQGSDPNQSTYNSPPDEVGVAPLDHSLNAKPNGLQIVYSDDRSGATIWQNSQAGSRVFLAPEYRVAVSADEALAHLAELPDLDRTVWIDSGSVADSDSPVLGASGSVRGFHVQPNEVLIDYHAKGPGILTLTDAYSDGWHAEIDGQETPVLSVDGVFRGIRVKSAGDLAVRFWYRPPAWTLSLILCGLGIVGLAVVCARRHRSRPIERESSVVA